MKSYLSITKNMFQTSIAWRFHFFMASLGNILYLVFLYFLWKSIFESAGTETLNGMTFQQVFVYMAIVSSVVVLFKTYSEWEVSRRVRDGNIIMDLLKPMDFQLQYFARSLGIALFNGITITLPVLILLKILWGDQFNGGFALIGFGASIFLAYTLSYLCDFMTGVVSFYTESIWGFSMAKDTTILFLAGAIVPMPFFPESVQTVLSYLPFQAIYLTPVSMLTDRTLTAEAALSGLAIQLFWVVVLIVASRIFFNKSLKTVTVNGG